MKRLGIRHLKVGMKVARSIYRADGQVLLGNGISLTDDYILRLPQQGITSIYVEDKRVEDIKITDMISEKLRTKALKKTREINDLLAAKYLKRKNEKGNKEKTIQFMTDIHKELDKLAKEIVEDFYLTENPMINLIDARLNEDYIYSHMLNVTILSILIGKALGYNEQKLVNLAKGCLIHDIGIIATVPKEVREKKGKLTEVEYDLIKNHSKFGYDYIKEMRDLSILSAHVIYQHHERYNGNGYPRGLAKDKITEYGYIAGLADVYDAITNNKTYKLRVLPDKAREFLLVAKDKFFPAYIIEKFLEKIPAYPNGTTVILSNDFEGVVFKQNMDNLSRPLVRIIKEGNKELKKGYDINLMENHSLMVKEILD